MFAHMPIPHACPHACPYTHLPGMPVTVLDQPQAPPSLGTQVLRVLELIFKYTPSAVPSRSHAVRLVRSLCGMAKYSNERLLRIVDADDAAEFATFEATRDAEQRLARSKQRVLEAHERVVFCEADHRRLGGLQHEVRLLRAQLRALQRELGERGTALEAMQTELALSVASSERHAFAQWICDERASDAECEPSPARPLAAVEWLTGYSMGELIVECGQRGLRVHDAERTLRPKEELAEMLAQHDGATLYESSDAFIHAIRPHEHGKYIIHTARQPELLLPWKADKSQWWKGTLNLTVRSGVELELADAEQNKLDAFVRVRYNNAVFTTARCNLTF